MSGCRWGLPQRGDDCLRVDFCWSGIGRPVGKSGPILLVHPAGIADSIPMVRIGRFQLDPWNRSKRVQSSGGMY